MSHSCLALESQVVGQGDIWSAFIKTMLHLMTSLLMNSGHSSTTCGILPSVMLEEIY